MDFPNVNPTPFAFATPPASVFGRSLAPQLPPVGGYSRADLERMRFALAQSGADNGMLDRIETVIAMRNADATMGGTPLMLRPTQQKQSRVGRVVGDAVQQRQNLIDALAQRPQ